MESEIYLSHEEAIYFYEIVKNDIQNMWNVLDEIGLQWLYQRGQYQIMDQKKWLLGKIKYGI